jgi:hypothetical protein
VRYGEQDVETEDAGGLAAERVQSAYPEGVPHAYSLLLTLVKHKIRGDAQLTRGGKKKGPIPGQAQEYVRL